MYMRRGMYVLNFFHALRYATPLYFHASFLISRGIPEELVGLVYGVGFLASILGLIAAPYLLQTFGNYRTFAWALAVSSIGILSLPFLPYTAFLLGVFVLVIALSGVVLFSMDMFLEGLADNENETGGIRGLFLMFANLGFFAAPLIGGYLAGEENFAHLYAFTALMSVPILLLLPVFLKRFRDPHYKPISAGHILALVRASRDIRGVYYAQFLLQFFYGAMIIFMPIYLHEHLGFTFAETGIMFSLMLLPFVVLPAPLGWLSDTRFGEKEMLVVGLAITALSTAFIPFIPNSVFAAWAGLLIATRVGASIVETMADVYFFKHVDGDDSDIVSAYRIVLPAAHVSAPILGSLFLLFFPIQYIFIPVAILVATGIPVILAVCDTR